MTVGKGWVLSAGLVFGCALALATFCHAAAAGDGAATYAAKCKGCHGPEGKGDGPAGAKLKPPASDLTNAGALKLKTAAEVTDLLKKGGKAVGLAPTHRPFANLSEQEMSALVEFVLGLRK